MNIIVNFLGFFCLLKATYSRYTINSENGIGANFEIYNIWTTVLCAQKYV